MMLVKICALSTNGEAGEPLLRLGTSNKRGGL